MWWSKDDPTILIIIHPSSQIDNHNRIHGHGHSSWSYQSGQSGHGHRDGLSSFLQCYRLAPSSPSNPKQIKGLLPLVFEILPAAICFPWAPVSTLPRLFQVCGRLDLCCAAGLPLDWLLLASPSLMHCAKNRNNSPSRDRKVTRKGAGGRGSEAVCMITQDIQPAIQNMQNMQRERMRDRYAYGPSFCVEERSDR